MRGRGGDTAAPFSWSDQRALGGGQRLDDGAADAAAAAGDESGAGVLDVFSGRHGTSLRLGGSRGSFGSDPAGGIVSRRTSFMVRVLTPGLRNLEDGFRC
jgi:hypothetical protein